MLKLDFPVASAINANEAHFNGPTRLGFRHRVAQAWLENMGSGVWKFFGRNLEVQRPERQAAHLRDGSFKTSGGAGDLTVSGVEGGIEKRETTKIQQIESSVKKGA